MNNDKTKESFSELLSLVEKFFPENKISETFIPLLKNNINATVDGWSILHLCAYRYEIFIKNKEKSERKSFRKLIQLLIQHDININLEDACDRTPICFVSSTPLLQYLIKNGAIINSQEAKAVSPLHVIGSLFNRLTINAIEETANPNLTDKYHRTPLHCASANTSSFQIYNVRALVYYSPESLEVTDKFGHYPLSYALMFSANEESIDFLIQKTPLSVLEKIQKQISDNILTIPENKSEENSLLNELRILDDIYNIPPRFKIYFGGAPKKEKIKNNIQEKIELEIKAKIQNRETIECNGFIYYIHKDNHGGKHTSGSKPIQENWETNRKKVINTWENNDATFNLKFANNYQKILKDTIISVAHNNNDSNFVRFKEFVGWDKGSDKLGEETKIIELYYEDNIGSHMRPKSESVLSKDTKIIDVISDKKIQEYLQNKNDKNNSTTKILKKISEIKEEKKLNSQALSTKELIEKSKIIENSDKSMVSIRYENFHIAQQFQSQILDEEDIYKEINQILQNENKFYELILSQDEYKILTVKDFPEDKNDPTQQQHVNSIYNKHDDELIDLPDENYEDTPEEIAKFEEDLFKMYKTAISTRKNNDESSFEEDNIEDTDFRSVLGKS